MLRNEIKSEDRKATAPGVQYGTCRFCGQVSAIEPATGSWDQKKLDECATETCSCEKAKVYAGRKERLELTAKLIEEKFGHSSQEDDYFIEDCQEVCELLNTVARAVVYGRIEKATVRINAKIKCDISLNKKSGRIKIDRTIVHKDCEES